MPGAWPRVDMNDKEAVRRDTDHARLRLFDIVREFLEFEGLTDQCCYFVQAKLCGYPYTPLNRQPKENENVNFPRKNLTNTKKNPK